MTATEGTWTGTAADHVRVGMEDLHVGDELQSRTGRRRATRIQSPGELGRQETARQRDRDERRRLGRKRSARTHDPDLAPSRGRGPRTAQGARRGRRCRRPCRAPRSDPASSRAAPPRPARALPAAASARRPRARGTARREPLADPLGHVRAGDRVEHPPDEARAARRSARALRVQRSPWRSRSRCSGSAGGRSARRRRGSSPSRCRRCRRRRRKPAANVGRSAARRTAPR